jgi:hypothetical protein
MRAFGLIVVLEGPLLLASGEKRMASIGWRAVVHSTTLKAHKSHRD